MYELSLFLQKSQLVTSGTTNVYTQTSVVCVGLNLASLCTTSEWGGEHSEKHSRKFSFVLDKGTMTSGMTSLLLHTHIFLWPENSLQTSLQKCQ